MSRSYAIVGTGAIGGYYGACLQQAGFPVHFLLHRDYQYVKEQGLAIASVKGNFELPQVNAYNDPAQIPPCDVVVVALKTTQNHLLSQILPALVRENSVVLLLQNGLGIEEEVAQIPGVAKMIGGLCFVCSNKVGPGQIHHLDYGQITLGEFAPNYHPCGLTETLEQLAADLTVAGIEIQLSQDLLLSRWKKLVWNIPYNGLSVVLDAKTDAIMADEGVKGLVQDLMEEVVLGATADDRKIPESFIQTMLDHTTQMKPYLTSMKLDYDGGRPLELEAILGKPLQRARSHRIHLPRIEMLYRQLKFLDERNRQQLLR